MEFGKHYEEVKRALPYYVGEIDKLHRQYVINVIYTLVGDPFSDWVNEVMTARNERIARERNLNIEMDPEVHKAFMASTSVSGKFQNMIALFYIL